MTTRIRIEHAQPHTTAYIVIEEQHRDEGEDWVTSQHKRMLATTADQVELTVHANKRFIISEQHN